MTKVFIVYHSGYGHTKLQADAISAGAKSVEGTEVTMLTAEEATENIGQLESADAIVFGSPTYMGSASAPMKAFMEASSKPWFEQKWKDKIAGGFTNSGSLSGDKLATLQQFSILAAQHGMLWVSLGLPNATATPDVTSGDPSKVNRIGAYLGAVLSARESLLADQSRPHPTWQAEETLQHFASTVKAIVTAPAEND